MPLRKKLAFATIAAVGLLIALEVGLWLVGVRPAYQRFDAYAGLTPRSSHFVVSRQEDGKRVVSLAPSKREVLNPIRFTVDKPAGTYRIVCLGGSTTYGRPFYDATSFPGHLREFLPAADPSRAWEVINAGAISYASYRDRGLMRELARYEPDLFILYMGHNEFLERRTYASAVETPAWVRSLTWLASQTRTASVIGETMNAAGLTPSASPTLPEKVAHRKVYAVGPEAYTRDNPPRSDVLEQFEATARQMIDLARDAHAEILLIIPASNLRDFAPFKSEHRPGLSGSELAQWTRAFERGRQHQRVGQQEEALDAYDLAEAIDSRFAELAFRRGQTLWQLGRHAEARSAFIKAREEDVCPLRAPSEVVEILRRVADENRISILDFERIAEEQAEHLTPGEELFADHVHLNNRAAGLLASSILDALARQLIVHPVAEWGPAKVASIQREISGRIDHPLHAQQLQLLARMLNDLGQPEQALHRTQEAIELAPGDPEILTLLGQLKAKLGHPEEAVRAFERALVSQPSHHAANRALGALLLEQDRAGEAIEPLQKAVLSSPNDASARMLLGIAFRQTAQHSRALLALRSALSLSPTDPDLLYHLAQAEAAGGEHQAAILHLRQALGLRPDDQALQQSLRQLAAERPELLLAD